MNSSKDPLQIKFRTFSLYKHCLLQYKIMKTIDPKLILEHVTWKFDIFPTLVKSSIAIAGQVLGNASILLCRQYQKCKISYCLCDIINWFLTCPIETTYEKVHFLIVNPLPVFEEIEYREVLQSSEHNVWNFQNTISAYVQAIIQLHSIFK